MLGEARGIKPFVFIPGFMEGFSKAIDMKMPLDKEPVDTSQFVHPLTFLWKIRRNTPLQIPLQAGHVVQLTSVTLINLVGSLFMSKKYFFSFFPVLEALSSWKNLKSLFVQLLGLWVYKSLLTEVPDDQYPM